MKFISSTSLLLRGMNCRRKLKKNREISQIQFLDYVYYNYSVDISIVVVEQNGIIIVLVVLTKVMQHTNS